LKYKEGDPKAIMATVMPMMSIDIDLLQQHGEELMQ
jgi:hypothetical protein